MYKLNDVDVFSGKVECVKNLETSQIIPFDPANTDYQEYLRFLADGGNPLPADDDEQTTE